ncbi:MAG: AI-2E family transporter [Firmicutes bacterium]|nr:AI-2E family transporter [Bacillota bacterium]
MEIKPDNKFKQNLLLVVIGVCLLVGLMNFGKVQHALSVAIGLFMPLLVGGAIAFILNVPMHFFEKQFDKLQQHSGGRAIAKAKTPLCMIVTLLAFILVIIFIGNVIFPNLVESVKSIVDIVQRSYPGWIETLESHGINTQFMQKYFPELNSEKIISTLKDGGLALLNTASQAATSVFSALTNFVFGLFFALYILASKKRLGKQAKQIAYAYLKKSWADEVCEIASLSYKTFANFLSGQCLEAVILGFMFFIVLLIGGFPYAGTIAVIIGSMAIIPYIGAFIGLALGALLIAMVNLKKMVWFVIVFFIVQQIEGQIIYPRVVGGSVGLPALWTLLAVIVGGNVSGILGIVVFIPLFSVIYALLRRNVYRRLDKKKISLEI